MRTAQSIVINFKMETTFYYVGAQTNNMYTGFSVVHIEEYCEPPGHTLYAKNIPDV
jgi:hypothetical protein